MDGLHGRARIQTRLAPHGLQQAVEGVIFKGPAEGCRAAYASGRGGAETLRMSENVKTACIARIQANKGVSCKAGC
jgi:hypothetical protein